MGRKKTYLPTVCSPSNFDLFLWKAASLTTSRFGHVWSTAEFWFQEKEKDEEEGQAGKTNLLAIDVCRRMRCCRTNNLPRSAMKHLSTGGRSRVSVCTAQNGYTRTNPVSGRNEESASLFGCTSFQSERAQRHVDVSDATLS